MPLTDTTWVGRPAPVARAVEKRAVAAVALSDRSETQRVRYVSDQSDETVLTTSMVEQLREKLRAAEARELEEHDRSGVRLTPTADLETPDVDIDIDVEPVTCELAILAPTEISTPDAPPVAVATGDAPTLDVKRSSLEHVVSELPELDTALAPNSESNFYAGFDEEHPDGIFVATYQTIEANSPVFVTVHLPAGYTFRCAAMVEWVRTPEAGEAPGLGLKLCGVDASTQRLIRTFVRHRRPMFYLG